MIRTHKPRGYAWVCPSAFQQTPQIHDISYQDSEVAYTQDDILCDDAEHEYSEPERAAKRRRIEKIADDFLNGCLPSIRSARSSYQATEDAISGLYAPPKVGRHTFRRACTEFAHDHVSSDEMDDGEVLRAFCATKRPQLRIDAQAGIMPEAVETLQEHVVMEVQAQASCGPKLPSRATRVSIGPSEAALRKAAELRNRKSQRLMVATQNESQPQSCPRPVVAESQPHSFDATTDDAVSDCGPSPTPAWTSSKWIRSGALELRRKAVDEECSRDELGASSVFTPSQRARESARPMAGEHGASSFQAAPVPSRSTVPAISTQSTPSGITDDRTRPQNVPYVKTDTSTGGESAESTYQTAPNDHCVAASHFGSQSHEDDSQSTLLARQGIRAMPRKSWATVNDTLLPEQCAVVAESAPRHGTPMSSIIRASFQQSEAVNAVTSQRRRKIKSAENTPADATRKTSNRRRTAPSESQHLDNELAKLPEDQQRRIGAFRTQYSSVQVNGASPFMFRKRASKFNDDDEPDVEPIPAQNSRPSSMTPQMRVELSSDASQMSKQALLGAKTVQAERMLAPPIMPLVTEHLNSILPKDVTATQHSSSVRKALRAEMMASGAEISRCSGDASSQAEQDSVIQASPPEHSSRMHNELENVMASLPHFVGESQLKLPWIGTQQLLAQAQADLFTSPDKTESAQCLGDETTPQDLPNRNSRRPLRQLSQDRLPMPSTQALLDNWHGWSSIKKPRPDGERPSLGHSPSIGKGLTSMIASDLIQSHESDSRRRSSLRHSTSCTESSASAPPPIPTSTNKVLVTQSFPSDIESTSDESFLKPEPPRRLSSGRIASSLSFGFSSINMPGQSGLVDNSSEDNLDAFARLGSSYQNAQQPRYSLDSQDLDVTLTEVVEDVLGSANKDMGSLAMSRDAFDTTSF